MSKGIKKENKYMSSVKVGPKGQIVIPKEIRDMFDISPGDSLMILADSKQGIAIEKYDVFEKIAEAVLAGKGRDIYPEHTEESTLEFAKNIKKMKPDREDN